MKVIKKSVLAVFVLLSVININLSAHGGEENNEHKKDTTVVVETEHTENHSARNHHDKTNMAKESPIIEATMNDFPSLHPLVVHFPIVLLLLAFFTQVLSFGLWKKQLDWATLLLLAGGLIGAYIASTFVHPHTTGLTEAAKAVLSTHDTFADYTLWLSAIALVLKAVSLFVFKDKKWLELIILLVIAGSAYSVSKAGHYGATLTHIHGVGAQGNFIETGEHNHSH